jgi:hypothetical protein
VEKKYAIKGLQTVHYHAKNVPLMLIIVNILGNPVAKMKLVLYYQERVYLG